MSKATLTTYKVAVLVAYRENVLHPESKTIHESLHGMGYSNVSSLKAAKAFSISLDCESEEVARKQVLEMSERLLANPVIEDWHILSIQAV